jgi:hypothetical protein
MDKEFYDNSLKQECKLLIVKNDKTQEYFKQFLIKYLNNDKKRIMGFDLEFNTPPKSVNQRTIAIFQLCFYFDKYNFIIFYNPALVTTDINTLMIKLLTNKNIIKIGHGTDSLDIPHLYKYLDTKENCINFTLSLYDTRFLCEYINIVKKKYLCSIYILLEVFNVVNREQIEYLNTNLEQLGEFWTSYIDITNLSDELINYSMYDALYLKKLLKTMKLKFKNGTFKLVTQLTRFVYLIKRNIIIFDDFSFLNICFLSNKQRLYDLFNKKLDSFKNKILLVPYFKSVILKMFQLKYYIYICDNNVVYKSKIKILSQTEINNTKNIYNKLLENLKLFPKIIKFLSKFNVKN